MFIKYFYYLPWENWKILLAVLCCCDAFKIQDSTCTLLFICGDNMRRKVSVFQVNHWVLSMVLTTRIWFPNTHYFKITHVDIEQSKIKSPAVVACGLAKILLWSRQAPGWRQGLSISNRKGDLSNSIVGEGGGCGWAWQGSKRKTAFCDFSFDRELTMRDARFEVLAQFIPLCTAAHVGRLSWVAKVLTAISPQWVTFIFSWKGNKGKNQKC